jgi:hypothetical protein
MPPKIKELIERLRRQVLPTGAGKGATATSLIRLAPNPSLCPATLAMMPNLIRNGRCRRPLRRAGNEEN